MASYRKKPVVIEAVQMPEPPGDGGTFSAAPQWLRDALASGDVQPATVQPDWLVHTLEGAMLCHPGDWIIRGVAGEIYPCKPEIFAATYEAA